jgi:hypothetical protein
MYLGDGYIWRSRRTYRLEVSLASTSEGRHRTVERRRFEPAP